MLERAFVARYDVPKYDAFVMAGCRHLKDADCNDSGKRSKHIGRNVNAIQRITDHLGFPRVLGDVKWFVQRLDPRTTPRVAVVSVSNQLWQSQVRSSADA